MRKRPTSRQPSLQAVFGLRNGILVVTMASMLKTCGGLSGMIGLSGHHPLRHTGVMMTGMNGQMIGTMPEPQRRLFRMSHPEGDPQEQQLVEAFNIASEASTLCDARDAVRRVQQSSRGYYSAESNSGKGIAPRCTSVPITEFRQGLW